MEMEKIVGFDVIIVIKIKTTFRSLSPSDTTANERISALDSSDKIRSRASRKEYKHVVEICVQKKVEVKSLIIMLKIRFIKL